MIIRISTDEFRDSKEGKCFKEIAREYCMDKGMSFNKLYNHLYGDYEFSCIERGNNKGYDFSIAEKRRCGDYYG